MGMATTTPDRDKLERDLKFPLLLVDGSVSLRSDGMPHVDTRLVNAQTMRLIAEVQRLRMAASRPDTSGEPVPGMIRSEDTPTTPEERWEALCQYRRYRQQHGASSGVALARLREVFAAALTSAERSASRPAAHPMHRAALDAFTGQLAYIDKVLRPRVERWNYDRPGLLG